MSTNAVARLQTAITQAEAYVYCLAALRARDPKEPGRRRKAAFEALLRQLLEAYWRGQEARIAERLKALQLAGRAEPFNEYFNAEFWKEENAQGLTELIRLLTEALRDGVALFGASTAIGLDYTLTNATAAAWGRDYAGELIKGINAATKQVVREQVKNFVATPGYTLADVMKGLPFGTDRAGTIATTEITRAYGQATQLAGEQLAEEFPDVRVVKQWFTNRDGLVCKICRPLNGKKVEIDAEFAPGISIPPAHPECRCWSSSTTTAPAQRMFYALAGRKLKRL